MKLTTLSLSAAAELVRKREVSPVELTRACLERIEHLNARLNAFITICTDAAKEQALAAEREIARGAWRGPLHGIPIGLKDLIDTAGIRTTAASAVFRNRVPEQDAEVVHRLKHAGAVIIGKTNLHEFAYGGSSVISAFGAVRNPVDPERTTGGSSGGSAAAVAAGMCYAALGTDTAGSIRLPAAYCGIVGLKPTYGLVPARGVVPLAWSLDHVGPLARTVEDAAFVLQAIAGYDPEDIDSREFAGDYANWEREAEQLSSVRIGVAREYFFADLDAEVSAQVQAAVENLRRLTAGVCEVAVPVDTDRTVSNAETWAYHAEYVARTPELYHPETLRRIQRGREIGALDYIRGRQKLERLRRETSRIFNTVDVILTPTAPVLPPLIADLEADIEQLRAKELTMLRNTRPFNVLGLPTISVPCGETSSGLPVGLQLSAALGCEAKLLAVARAAFEPPGAPGLNLD